jgi:DNA-binding transcriptional regulator/RsmH inhibitor MraZ
VFCREEIDMNGPFDDDILRDGYCWGGNTARIDDTGRLRLPKAIVDILTEHGVSRLWRAPDPRAKRFVLCPPDYRMTFITSVQQHFQEAEELDMAWRLVCSGTDARVDAQGRISIPQVCLGHADTGPQRQVQILGVGLWYEVDGALPRTGRT